MPQAVNGVVISAEDPGSLLVIRDCTFRNSYVLGLGASAGMGGVIYATGTLSVLDSAFEDNVMALESTPAPAEAPALSLTDSPQVQYPLITRSSFPVAL